MDIIRPTPQCDPPPPSDDPRAYFESLRALNKSTWDHDGKGELYEHAWSLRDELQILQVTNTPRDIAPRNPFWSYRPDEDTDAEKQDAAKFSLDPADIVLYNPGQTDGDPPRAFILLFPLCVPQASTDTLLLTWDHYYTSTWAEHIGDLNWKHYNLYTGNSADDRHTYLGPKVHFNRRDEGGINAGPTSVGTWGFSLIPNRQVVGGLAYDIPGIIETDGLIPTNGDVVTGTRPPDNARLHHHMSRWGRYWLEVQCSVPGADPRFDSWKALPSYVAESEAIKADFVAGTWICVSMWWADQMDGPYCLIRGLPWIPRATFLSVFGFEFDTSGKMTSMKGPGYPCVGYWRNVIGLRNYASPGNAFGVAEHDEAIFQRPR